MIKNERLISSMTFEQKIKLISSAERYASRTLDGYAFPVFRLSDNPLADLNARATHMPDDATLACSWNRRIVSDVYKCIGNESKAIAERAYFNVTDSANENVSSAEYAYAEFAAAKTRGLNQSGAYVNLFDLSAEDDGADLRTVHRLVYDIVRAEAELDSVTAATGETERKSEDDKTLSFGIASDKESFVRCLSEGCSYVYLTEDVTDDIVPYVQSLVEEDARAEDACRRGKMTREKLELCRKELKLLPAAAIDSACDKIIDLIVSLENNDAASVRERKISLGAREAKFDEPLHAQTALTAARQSVVLVKNNGVLPLKHEKKIAVIGEYAKDKSYHEWGNESTAEELPFEVINDYEFLTTGFAYGYKKGEIGRTDLHKTAVKLLKNSDAALLYLCADERGVIPPEQTECVNALRAANVPIIAIVAGSGAVDLSMENKCDALLYTGACGQKTAAAVFEIISGYVNPSGKFAFPVPMRIDDVTGEKSGERYPLGYGLSYTSFEYTHFSLSDTGVSLTVTNTGEHDGFATVQMYVQDPAEDDKRLRGYQKVFVKKKDSVKADIRFGEETFRRYDEKRKLFFVAGGVHQVFVGDSERNIRLKGELTLKEYYFEDEHFENTLEKEDTDGEKMLAEFADTEDKRAYFARKRGTSFGLKLALALLFMAYFDIAAVLLCYYRVIPDETYALVTVGAFAGIISMASLIFVAVSAVRYARDKKTPPAPLLGDVVENLPVFTELASVSYETPITPAEQAEEEAAKEEEAKQENKEPESEESIIRVYDTAFTEGGSESIKFREIATLGEMSRNFREYLLSCGVDIEPTSARAFVAATAASKLVFLDVKNKDIMPALVKAIGDYFGGVTAVEAKESWSRPDQLMWSAEGDRYVASGFVNAVYSAIRTPDKHAAAIITNVRQENLQSYFGDFIRYALFPSEEHVWRLNDETRVNLPHNIRYLLFTENGWNGMSRETAGASVQIELVVRAAAATEERVEPKNVSESAFADLVKEAREKYYMPESVWKKIDELIETINATESFAIGNKSMLQTERLTSALMACNADESEAFNLAFTAKLASRFKNLKMYEAENGDKTLIGIIEKLFTEEDLTKIRKSLAKTA